MTMLDPTSPHEGTFVNETAIDLTVDDIAQLQQLADPTAAEAPYAADIGEVVMAVTGDGETAPSDGTVLTPVIPPVARPIPPIRITKRAVSGRYRSAGIPFQLELRVDIDGKRPMMRVSGDYFQTSGTTTSYFGSMVVTAPVVNVTPTTVTIEGTGNFTFTTGFPKVKITIPRTTIFQTAAPASVQFFNLSNSPGAVYPCPFTSSFFRTVQYEQDRVATATLFTSYDTGSLPSGGPARVLNVVSAYAEAGIEFQTTGATNVVPTSNIGSSWSNAELHAAMEAHFSLWSNEPAWKVWLLAANIHDNGNTLRGIMFDQQGKQRQGCAVFHDVVGGASAESVRAQLRTYVHELGHCFNLLHSFQKSLANPPIPDRPAAKSWMNYVQNYPGGAAAYWAEFPFQFDDQELIHLRHAFRNDVITGGSDFAIGAADIDPRAFADALTDGSGLELVLSGRQSYASGEPVVVDISLTNRRPEPQQAQPSLHPNYQFVHIGIRRRGNDHTMVYEPLIDHCATEQTVILDTNTPCIAVSAFIGYGKGGFYFEQPGVYELRARYQSPDGSVVLSNVFKLRVRHPAEPVDEALADLFLGDEQGALLYLLGSDSPFLRNGNEAFDIVLDKHGSHRMADYARLVKGINAMREFKTITPDNSVSVRDPNLQESVDLLSEVVATEGPTAPVDPLTQDFVRAKIAVAEEMAGETITPKSAKTTRKRSSRR